MPKNSYKLILQLAMWTDEIYEWNIIFRHFVSTGSAIHRRTRAGLPATMLFGGTFLVTTLPAPTIEFSPTVTFARIVAPEPIEAPLLISVRSTAQSRSVCR